MKKNIKRTFAFLCSLPVAIAATACAKYPEVSETDKETVYADYLTRYETAIAALSDKENVYLDAYTVITMNVEQGEDKYSARQTVNYDLDIAENVLSRAAMETSIKTDGTSTGEEVNASSVSTVYYLSDGIYTKTVSTVSGETTDEKSFEPLTEGEESEPIDYSAFFYGMPSYTELTEETTEIKMYADSNGRGIQFVCTMPEEYGLTYAYLLNTEGLETKTETTVTYTVAFDANGELSYVETETVVKIKAIAPEESTTPEGETGSGEGESGGTESETETLSDVSEGEESETTLPADGKVYVRMHQKVTIKDGSTVKIPTSKVLETYKETASTPEEQE